MASLIIFKIIFTGMNANTSNSDMYIKNHQSAERSKLVSKGFHRIYGKYNLRKSLSMCLYYIRYDGF